MRELTSDPLPRNQHLHLNAEMQILQQREGKGWQLDSWLDCENIKILNTQHQ